MMIAGHDGILRLKIKRFEISFINCKVFFFPSSIDGSVCKTSGAPDQLLGKNCNMQLS